MKKKITALILSFLLIASLLCIKLPVYAIDIDYSAKPIELGKTYVSMHEKEEWYKFTTTDYCADYRYVTTNRSKDVVKSYFYDEDGAELEEYWAYDNNEEWVGYLKENTTYYLRLVIDTDYSDRYIDMDFSLTPEPDIADEKENATPYKFDTVVTEYLRPNDLNSYNKDQDWITFNTPDYTTELEFYIKDIDSYGFSYYIYDAEENIVDGKSKIDPPYEDTLKLKIPSNKKYYVCFSGYDGKYKYKITCKVDKPKQPDPTPTPTPTPTPKKKYSSEWINGKWYNADGSQTYKGTLSWKSNASGWWVEDTSGWYPQSQWQKIDGKWYYFCADGYMDYSEYRDGCWLNADGSMNPNYTGGHWCSDSKGWWYEDNGWYPCSQYVWIDGVRYWFGASGYWE